MFPDPSTTVENLWHAYLACRDRTERSRDLADGRARRPGVGRIPRRICVEMKDGPPAGIVDGPVSPAHTPRNGGKLGECAGAVHD